MDALKLLLLFPALLTGCGQFFSTQQNAGSGSQKPEAMVATRTLELNELSGQFKSESGDQINLKDLSEKPVVLMFAQKRCQSCQEEAVEILSSFRYEDKKSDVVNFVTVLVQAKNENVIDQWKNNLKRNPKNKEKLVPQWLHGIDNLNHDLYYQFFDQSRSGPPLTPAIVLFYPHKKEILSFTGRGNIPDDMSLPVFLNKQGFFWEQKHED